MPSHTVPPGPGVGQRSRSSVYRGQGHHRAETRRHCDVGIVPDTCQKPAAAAADIASLAGLADLVDGTDATGQDRRMPETPGYGTDGVRRASPPGRRMLTPSHASVMSPKDLHTSLLSPRPVINVANVTTGRH